MEHGPIRGRESGRGEAEKRRGYRRIAEMLDCCIAVLLPHSHDSKEQEEKRLGSGEAYVYHGRLQHLCTEVVIS